MPLLRGHHLICLHFFDGAGYDAAFINNLDDTLRRAEEHGVEITPEADDVCAVCPNLKEGACMQSENADEVIRMMDEKALMLLGLSVPGKESWKALKDKVPGIFPKWHSLFCVNCEWKSICEKNTLFRKIIQDIKTYS